MLLVGVLAPAPEILRSVDGQIVKVGTFAASFGALEFGSGSGVVLEEVVAEALGGGSDDFALEAFGVVPGGVKFLITIHR